MHKNDSNTLARNSQANLVAKMIEYENGKPTIERIKQGARLVEAGLVYRGWIQDEKMSDRYYQVIYAGIPASYTCGCEEWQLGKAPYSRIIGGPMCRHAWAAHLAWIGGEELSPPPIPFMGEPVVYKTNIYDEIDF